MKLDCSSGTDSSSVTDSSSENTYCSSEKNFENFDIFGRKDKF